MAVIVELSLSPENFPLGTVLTAETDLHIEFERIVPVGADVVPIFWAWDGDLDAFEQRVRDDTNVQQLLAIDEVGDRRLYLLNWDIPAGAFLEGLTTTEGIIRNAHGHGTDDWEFELLFPSYEHLTRFHNISRENDIEYTLGTIQSLSDAGASQLKNIITDKQREALMLAFQRGYFETPRQVTLSELATELDITQQSLSDRIRHGIEAIVEHTLFGASEP
ncbi:Predicted DNA binding protein, contains HTH domain [Haladaptatus litoreus]|uniref:Predicted DNA binding protein, contains HTH domain n=1 Tax=Haladaptatus litoreus TaxID=553468 RepID=A0A1N7FFD4_9EURY|nr:helix-turn-helix domain-containing protein [Haladaptatus litoreus]SIR98945.1 Predicted DNA binding protein, contains HTH domain [Haladaptatus litoreus]